MNKCIVKHIVIRRSFPPYTLFVPRDLLWVLQSQCFSFGALYPSKSGLVHKNIVKHIVKQITREGEFEQELMKEERIRVREFVRALARARYRHRKATATVSKDAPHIGPTSAPRMTRCALLSTGCKADPPTLFDVHVFTIRGLGDSRGSEPPIDKSVLFLTKSGQMHKMVSENNFSIIRGQLLLSQENKQATKQPSNQASNCKEQSPLQPSKQPTNQPTNQPTKQPTNQPTNQQTNKQTKAAESLETMSLSLAHDKTIIAHWQACGQLHFPCLKRSCWKPKPRACAPPDVIGDWFDKH